MIISFSTRKIWPCKDSSFLPYFAQSFWAAWIEWCSFLSKYYESTELWFIIPSSRGSGDSNTHSCVTRDHMLINSIVHLWTNYHICTGQVHPTSNFNLRSHLNKLSLKKSPVHPISILQAEVKMFSRACSAASFPSTIPSIREFRIMSSPVQQRADLPSLSKCFSLLSLLWNILPQPLPLWLGIGGEVNFVLKGLGLGKQTPDTMVP